MKRLRLGLALLGMASALAAAPAAAQFQQQGAYREDAGVALTRHLRTLSDQPRSLHALTGAGKAALELGDPQAALTFFARAEEVAPRDGRVKAGMGSAFLAMEQPQTAMRFFTEAASLGVPEAEFAGDRGLVHDLNGDSRRAQADYALALSRGENDEVRRRLALSLAISGDRDRALSTIDAQVRRQDRAAWRTRAFILALSGDAPGATSTAEAMIPGQAAQLQPFFSRLPSLNAAQRALAVHFGHFPGDGQTTQAAGTQYAGTAPAAGPSVQAGQTALGTRRRPAQPATQPAAEQPDARQASIGSSRAQRPPKAAPPQPRREVADEQERYDPWDRGARRRTRTATATPKPAAPPPVAQQRAEAPPVTRPPAQSPPPVAQQRAEAAPLTQPPAQSPPPVAQQRAEAAPLRQPSANSPPPAATANLGSLVESLPADTPAATAARNVPAATAPSEPPPSQQPLTSAAQAASIQTTSLPPSTVPTPEPVRQAPAEAPAQTSASTFANIAAAIATLPEEKAPTPPAPHPERIQLAEAKPPPPAARTPAPAAPKESKPKATEAEKPAAAKGEAASKKPAPDKSPADKSAAAKKDAADKKEPASKKETPPKEPSRHWVQIAGGANEAAMTSEFKRLKGKAPKLLGARTAWTTPLRATNRLLVGPFKTPAEAQEFVNELAKLDVAAFSWTSPAGQEIVKLSAK